MTTRIPAISLVLALASMPALTLAQTTPHIDVSGHAERQVQPDRFHIDMKVESADIKPARARARVEANMAKVTAGFRANHALPESIVASTISIGPHERYEDNRDTVDGTEVTRTASATFTRMEDLRNFIDGLDTAGEELQITGTEMTRSDAEAIDNDLREQAMHESQRNAERIAKAYGAKVGAVYTVSDQPTGRSSEYPPPPSVEVMANGLPKIDLEVGSLKMERTIYATFLLDPTKP
ncbi:MAG TPA: SIMPL domain-containing protein [Luteibacter sp.]|jgi:hypothetical protein|uniref:SIMPL domain-containing protein n=1 Tax=Luteibacter sp. TaxID=1886636 RepID=UPI002F42C69A